LLKSAIFHLPGDPVEVVGASDDVQPVVMPRDVAPHPDVAESTDLTIEMSHGSTPQDVAFGRAPAVIAAD
jgi:hypothetical protein